MDPFLQTVWHAIRRQLANVPTADRSLRYSFHVMNQLIRPAASAFEVTTVWRFIDSIIIFLRPRWYIPEKEKKWRKLKCEIVSKKKRLMCPTMTSVTSQAIDTIIRVVGRQKTVVQCTALKRWMATEMRWNKNWGSLSSRSRAKFADLNRTEKKWLTHW